MPRTLKVTVRDQNRVITVTPEPSQNLRVALLRAKMPLYPKIMGMQWLGNILNCHGKGMCGACMIRVVDNPAGLTDRTPTEITRLGPTSPHARLACQAWVCDDVTVDLAKTSLASAELLLQEAETARQSHEQMLAEG